MKIATISYFRNNLDALSRSAKKGEEITVTRNGKPFFKMVRLAQDDSPAITFTEIRDGIGQFVDLLDSYGKLTLVCHGRSRSTCIKI